MLTATAPPWMPAMVCTEAVAPSMSSARSEELNVFCGQSSQAAVPASALNVPCLHATQGAAGPARSLPLPQDCASVHATSPATTKRRARASAQRILQREATAAAARNS